MPKSNRDCIIDIYLNMEKEFYMLQKTSYPKNKLNGYEDALYDFKVISEYLYKVALPTINQFRIELYEKIDLDSENKNQNK